MSYTSSTIVAIAVECHDPKQVKRAKQLLDVIAQGVEHSTLGCGHLGPFVLPPHTPDHEVFEAIAWHFDNLKADPAPQARMDAIRAASASFLASMPEPKS